MPLAVLVSYCSFPVILLIRIIQLRFVNIYRDLWSGGWSITRQMYVSFPLSPLVPYLTASYDVLLHSDPAAFT